MKRVERENCYLRFVPTKKTENMYCFGCNRDLRRYKGRLFHVNFAHKAINMKEVTIGCVCQRCCKGNQWKEGIKRSIKILQEK